MTTFTEFKEKQPAVLEQQQLILERVEGLCVALREQYRTYSLRSFNQGRALNPGSSDYYQKQIDAYMVGDFPMRFVIESGRKYHKIVMEDESQRSVHAFVDKKSGDVYKAASWKAPAKGVRYNLVSKDNYEMLKARCDWSGGYLYK